MQLIGLVEHDRGLVDHGSGNKQQEHDGGAAVLLSCRKRKNEIEKKNDPLEVKEEGDSACPAVFSDQLDRGFYTVLVGLKKAEGYVPDLTALHDLRKTHGRGRLKVFCDIAHKEIHEDQGTDHSCHYDQGKEKARQLTNPGIPENKQIERNQEKGHKVGSHDTEKEGQENHK